MLLHLPEIHFSSPCDNPSVSGIAQVTQPYLGLSHALNMVNSVQWLMNSGLKFRSNQFVSMLLYNYNSLQPLAAVNCE